MEKTLGRYRVLRELGKGGMGIIYKSLDPGSQQHVAIKVLPPTMVDRTMVERFNREAQAMTKLKHPNMVGVFDFGMEKGQHYFVMEFVDGENLKTIIKQKKFLSIKDTIDIVIHVAEALAYTHDEGIIHRDVKPGNIMITHDGKVKVMDFGLAKILGVTNVTVEGTSLGTAEYMSPEQSSDEGVDQRTDIYSLGVTMYEMLTGRPPFQGDNPQAVMMKHKTDTPKPVRDLRREVPPELERITMKAMAKDLHQRYQRARELIDDLKKLQGGPAATEIKTEPQTVIAKTEVADPQPVQKPVKEKSVKVTKARSFSMVPLFGLAGLIALGWFVYNYRDNISSTFSSIETKVQGETGLVAQTEEYLAKLEKAEEHHRRGMKYFQDGLINKSISEYRKAIRLRPKHAGYYRDLAYSYEKKKQYKKAIRAWEDLLKYDQSSSLAGMARQEIQKLQKP